MKSAHFIAALVGTLSLSASFCYGQAILTFTDSKNFLMEGPFESDYLGGSLDVNLSDGSFAFLPCGAVLPNGSSVASGLFPVFITPSVGCASGTTGLISMTADDFDGDGVRDSGSFVSVTQPIPALQVEPFRTSLISLFSAPPSDLPRPLGGFSWTDASTIIFFDLVNDPRNGRSFELTSYNSSRPYTALELERQRDEIVPGSYIFTFPALNTTPDFPRDFPVNITHREMVEAFPGPGGTSIGSAGVSVGNDFRLTNDDRWFDGMMEFDPRLVLDFTWEGFNAQTFLAGDRLFFSILNPFTGAITFPPFPPGQTASSQLIAGNGLPIANGFEIGPSILDPDDGFVAGQLEFRRNLQVGNTVDTSVRFFNWLIRLIDSFEGFQGEAFPATSTDEDVEPTTDFDGDGYTNLEEFGLQTDPVDPASVPNITPTIDVFTGHCELTVEKRPSVGSRLIYTIEYTLDFEEFFTIDENDPNFFLVTDDADEISVLSRRPADQFPCFTRVRLTLRE